MKQENPTTAGLRVAFNKRLRDLTPAEEGRLLRRGRTGDPEIEREVRRIVDAVRFDGDRALREMARRFDGVELERLDVPRQAWRRALDRLEPDLRSALEMAADNIAAFHAAQMPPPLDLEVTPGVRLGRRAEPLARVGAYAPGGRASYSSSVLMGVIPARVAGVAEVLVCSPPGPDGLPPAAVLAAAEIAAADRLLALGGAGAVAAMAYGTASIPAVDRIVGPGNAYVTEAKRQLSGVVGTDCPAGPSEILVLADGSADAELIAAELIAQAEHDPEAAAALVATRPDLVRDVERALERLLPDQPRREIIVAALAASGALLLADSLDEALAFATRYAPEHLLLLVDEPRAALDRVRGAGTVFLGPGSSVAFGDYVTGANHVLPTGGLARAHSGLSTLDFMRWTTYQEVSGAAAARLAGPTATLAESEGLPAHALAARLRASPSASGNAVDAPAPSPARPERAGGVPLRTPYRDIPIYDPGRRGAAVDLSDNTNLFGVPPSAAAALDRLGGEVVSRYPQVFADRLKRVLADRHGVQPANIATGCGSDDVIDSAVRAFCDPGDVVAYPAPTFGMIGLFSRMNAAQPRPVPLGPHFELDADGLLAARARLIYICRPNNPTGTLFERSAIERVEENGRSIVLLDEAYAEFAGEDMASWAAGSRRALALRTLSKAYGLAGLRVGYAVGPAGLIAEIEKSRGPYKVNAAGEAAAVAALTEDAAWVADVVERVRENRARLAAELARLGLRSWESAANFLLVAVPGGVERAAPPESGLLGGFDASTRAPSVTVRFADALRERGVEVRAFPLLPGTPGCIRVTIGPWAFMERFLDAVREALGSSSRNGEGAT